MKYALGNMLNGAGGLNPDGLSLDLQFATDKVLTARKGPTPVLTRASTATFIGSDGLIQTAAVDQARFDHDPTTLDCKGLLIEEQRTNDIRSSTAPATQTRTVTAVPYTLSFYGTGTIVLSGVHVATVTGTGAYPTRAILTFTPTAGSLVLTITGSVTNAQLEAGAFATSWIQTPSFSSVTRSADACSITGSNFTGIWNRFAGTCVIGVGSSLGTGPRFVSNSAAARTTEIYGTTSIDFFEAGGTNEVRIVTSPTYPIKLGLAYAINDYQSAYSGLISGSDTNTGGTIPDATALYIGSLGGSGSRLTGHISFIRYYKKRLANAKLQTLTT